MIINYLNSCIQVLNTISELKISIIFIILSPFIVGGIWLIHVLYLDKKKNTDKLVPNENWNPNDYLNNKYLGKIRDRNSYNFKCTYYYCTNELYVTIAAGLLLITAWLDLDCKIVSWRESKLEIIFISVLLLITAKLIIQGIFLFTIIDMLVLLSQLFIAQLLISRLSLLVILIFRFLYIPGLIGSIKLYKYYKKLKKDPFERFSTTIITSATSTQNSNS